MSVLVYNNIQSVPFHASRKLSSVRGHLGKIEAMSGPNVAELNAEDNIQINGLTHTIAVHTISIATDNDIDLRSRCDRGFLQLTGVLVFAENFVSTLIVLTLIVCLFF